MAIKSEVITALRWTAGARFTAQIGTWAITIYVIRILSPEDYGLMSMAAILMAFTVMVNEFGVIQALIQKNVINEYLTKQVFGFIIVTNTVIFIFVILVAPYFAAFFETEQLTLIVRVLAISLLMGGASAVPMALLQREMKFKRIAIVEFVSTLLGSITTLVLAILGSGVWALVLGNLVLQGAKAVGILFVSRFCLRPVFRFDGFQQIFNFGAKLTAQKFLWYVNTQADVLLVGKLLGQEALGLYSVAFHLANLPMTKAMTIINQVTFPAYSRLQNDKILAASYFLKSVQLSFLIFIPILWGISSVSSDFVDVFLGEKWTDGKIVLQLITLIIPFRTLSMLLAPLTVGLGRPGLGLRNLFTFTITVPAAILIGINWGLVGVCVSLLIASACVLAINFRRSLPVIGVSWGDLYAALVPSLISGLVMYVAVVVVRTHVVPDVSSVMRLSILIATGATAYIAMTLMVNRDTARQSIALIIGSKA